MMRLEDAKDRLTSALATATNKHAEAVRTILEHGAGLMGLPEGAVLNQPAGLVPERREAWCSLVDALRIDALGVDSEWHGDAEFVPVRAGQWESVLATLIIERDWTTIERVAAELQADSRV